MKISVYGTGCTKCRQAYERIVACVEELGVDAEVEKVRDIIKIYQAGIMTTPAIAIDGKIASAGQVPSVERIKQWLQATSKGGACSCGCCCGQ